MSTAKTEVPYGTLDLLILKTLDTMGPLHGYSLARRIEQVSEDLLRLSQGSIYPALIRLEQQGSIRTEWGVSDTNRKVKVYALTDDRRPAAARRRGELGARDGARRPVLGGEGVSLRHHLRRLLALGAPSASTPSSTPRSRPTWSSPSAT